MTINIHTKSSTDKSSFIVAKLSQLFNFLLFCDLFQIQTKLDDLSTFLRWSKVGEYDWSNFTGLSTYPFWPANK